MDDINDVLLKSVLFKGITKKDLEVLMVCLSTQEKHFSKGEYIYIVGDDVNHVGIILSGCVHIVRDDYFGNRDILATLKEGDIFGETCAAFDDMGVPNSVVAVEETTVMFVEHKRLLTVCQINCEFHTKVVYNMLRVVADKNVLLTQKLELLAKRTTRDKLLSYLSSEAQKQKAVGKEFKIPLKRQELADYLGVDRSAMSTELGKLKAEGLIDFKTSRFKLLNTECNKI